MFFTVAWKNIWRNKTRSSIIIAAIALGLFGGLLASGVSFGMGEQMIAAAISTRLSHIQIHQKNFRENQNIADTIPNAPSLMSRLRRTEGVSGAALRVVVMAMASSPVTAAGVELMGVNPDNEKLVSDIPKKTISGNYFGGKIRNPVVIGQALADELDLKVGSKMIFNFQNDSGDITGGAFRVAGIFKTVSSTFDKSIAFIQAKDLQRLIGAPAAWHECAITVSPRIPLDSAVARVRSAAGGDLQIDTWRQLAPDLAYVSESLAATLYIFMIVILSALAFGIVNTMLMVILERRRELGMLMAIGMPKKTVFGMIIIETILLALTGALLGMVFTAGVMRVLSHKGIDLSILSRGLSRFGIPEILYPSLPLNMYPFLMLMVIATATIAALYPAIKALRLRPSEALRR